MIPLMRRLMKTKEVRKKQKCEDLWELHAHDVNGETCMKVLSQGSSQASPGLYYGVNSEPGSEGPGKAPRPRLGRDPRQTPSCCHRASPPHLH